MSLRSTPLQRYRYPLKLFCACYSAARRVVGRAAYSAFFTLNSSRGHLFFCRFAPHRYTDLPYLISVKAPEQRRSPRGRAHGLFGLLPLKILETIKLKAVAFGSTPL
jgi:hypothetical protein